MYNIIMNLGIINDWFSVKIKKIGFEDVKIAVQRPNQYVIINTLPVTEQEFLIKNTIDIFLEEKKINEIMENYLFKQYKIIIYGKNSTDESIEKKYHQLNGLGFNELYIYYGGLFEWMLLQDIYGENEFPTTSKLIDILKYRPMVVF